MASPVAANGSERPKSSLTTFQKVLSFLAAPIFIIVGVIIFTPMLDKEIDQVEMVYDVTIAEAPSSILNRGIIVVDRNENRIKCQLPTKDEVRTGVPMKCLDRNGDPILIKARHTI